MTIIGDAVAGANFELSEPLATHRHDKPAKLETEGTAA
jgi:uroporphyrin-III C-methyltransferase/precorrin-2 dehydrogenase/sirohydrochlorin ferrochelatase